MTGPSCKGVLIRLKFSLSWCAGLRGRYPYQFAALVADKALGARMGGISLSPFHPHFGRNWILDLTPLAMCLKMRKLENCALAESAATFDGITVISAVKYVLSFSSS